MTETREHIATSAGTSFTLGVDLGGTKIDVALVDRAGSVVSRVRRATHPHRGPERVLEEVVSCLTEFLLGKGSRSVIGVGVGIAGQVDPQAGIVRYAPNLRWKDVSLREQLEDRLSLPVMVMNDVQAVTYGEWMHGAGRNVADLVCLFVGTGIGGGVVSGGHLIMGCSGNAGELGHMTIERDGPRCSCGNHGCLEALASGWAIAKITRELVEKDPKAGRKILRCVDGDLGLITAGTIAEAFNEGDPLARNIVEDVGRSLGIGMANIANAFNPSLLVLGGGVVDGLPALLDLAEREARGRALDAASRPLRIVKAALGSDAGAIGAAARIRDRLVTETAAGRP